MGHPGRARAGGVRGVVAESHLSDGETLLNYALRREFVGGVVTNDRMQFRAALERAEGEPAASAARLAFAHHLVPYAFEGAEMRFSTRAHAESSESSESPESRASDFEGTRRGDFEEIRATASADEARRRDARRDVESAGTESAAARVDASDAAAAAAAERVADEADWVDAMRAAEAAEAAEREETEAKVAADEAAASAARAITPRRTRTRRCMRRTVRRTRGRVADHDRQAGQDAARRASENEAILIRLEEYSTRRDGSARRRTRRRDESRDESRNIWNSRMARASVIDTNERTNKRTGRRFETTRARSSRLRDRSQSLRLTPRAQS